MPLVIPKIRARDALAAMEECSLDDDDHREFGHTAVVSHGVPDFLIANNLGPTGNAKPTLAAAVRPQVGFLSERGERHCG